MKGTAFGSRPDSGNIPPTEGVVPEYFGFPELEGGRLLRIVEKPLESPRSMARGTSRQLGLRSVKISEPSVLSGLWVTVNNIYTRWSEMNSGILKTFEPLPRANQLTAKKERRKAGHL